MEVEREEAKPKPQNETNTASFSKLLERVMPSNSSVSAHPVEKDSIFEGQFGMSHQEALASVTAKATVQLQERNCIINSSNLEPDDIPKTPNSDGFSWRKYGQKQVKNSGTSRSYYRCTFYNCSTKKKVQHMDITGKIIEVVYTGEHNHDPPQNLKGSTRKRDKDEQIAEPLNHKCREECVISSDKTAMVKNEASTLRKDTADENRVTDSMKEYIVVPFKKRRIQESRKGSSESVYRTFKEPKVVVHANEDVRSSSDGYRWRKYGQKMVKGNPNPRSYYRCSSSGCPVRKHVEKSTDNSSAIVVTYEGIHDHEKPLPKGSPKSDQPKSPIPREEGSGRKGDKPNEGGSDKVLESARALLSIGIKLESC